MSRADQAVKLDNPRPANPAGGCSFRPLDGNQQRWVRWFRFCRLPDDHIAAVMGFDLAAVAAYAGVWSTHPSGPPRTIAGEPRGPTAAKIRNLYALEYQPDRIAEFLALPLAAVREFLRRLTCFRDGGRRARPRTHVEGKAHEAAARRRRQRERRQADRQAMIAARAAWGTTRAAELAEWMEARAKPPAPSIDDQAVAELPPVEVPAIAAALELEAWSGPTSPHSIPRALNGRAKLSDEHVAEIRRDRAAGETIAAIAYRFGITCNAVRAALRPPE